MTWSNAPQPGDRGAGPGGPHGAPEQRWESPADREARLAWERGGTTLFPAGAMADRIVTILLLAFGAVLTIVVFIAGIIALVTAIGGCHAAAGCSPGGVIGGTALAVGGAFIVGVATVVAAIGAWVRRRSSWWIAAAGFVLATVLVVWGGVVFAQAADGIADRAGTSSASRAA